jgi:hypothetical protein
MERMNIEDACRAILGNSLADSIIASQGIHWAVVAAVASARTSDDPRALEALDKRLAEIRADQPAQPPSQPGEDPLQ